MLGPDNNSALEGKEKPAILQTDKFAVSRGCVGENPNWLFLTEW